MLIILIALMTKEELFIDKSFYFGLKIFLLF